MKTRKKQISKQLQRRINEINTMLEQCRDEYPVSYFGSTYPTYLVFSELIRVNNQFVYFVADKNMYNNIASQRFNCNDPEQLDELKYNLTHIRRALKETIKYL